MAKKFLALDIGAANVALAEYEEGAKGALTLVRYGLAPLAASLDSGDPQTILVPALMEIVRTAGIKPGPVAISVSGQMAFYRFAAIPSAGSEEKFDQLVRYEIEQNVPFPIDEMVSDRQVLGETESGDKSVMIVSAKVDQIEAITSAVASAGFRPELVDVAPIALTNALKAVRPDDESSVVLLDIGAKTTSLVIVEGDKVYNRSIPIAGNNITRDIAQTLGCTHEEAERLKREQAYVAAGGVVEDEDPTVDSISKVCRAIMSRLQAEISRSINFYRSQQGGSAPTRLHLTGGTALLPRIDEFFAENLHIEVEFFNPFEAIGVGPTVDAEAFGSDAALLAATAGVALHQVGTARFTINLLPPSIVAARAEKAKVPVVAAAGVLLVGALVLGLCGVYHSAEVTDVVYDKVEAKQASLKGFERKVKSVQEEVEKATTEADGYRKLLLARSAMASRLNAVRSALAPGMWIEKWEPGRVTIRGWKDRLQTFVDSVAKKNGGKRETASEIVVARLKGNVIVESASISDMKAIGKNANIEQFTVELTFK